LDSSFFVSTQAPLQFEDLPLHETEQPPSVHTGLAPFGAVHALPQAPQFFASRFVSTQAPPHATFPQPHEELHAPEEHVAWPPAGLGQLFPQAPQ